MKRRILDLLLYISIGLGLVIWAIIYAKSTAKQNQFDPRWPALAVCTSITFYYTLRDYRRRRRRLRFWIIIGLLMATHLAGYITALLKIDGFRLIWIAIITPVEMAGLSLIIRKTIPWWSYQRRRLGHGAVQQCPRRHGGGGKQLLRGADQRRRGGKWKSGRWA